jgi:hypothetical protein
METRALCSISGSKKAGKDMKCTSFPNLAPTTPYFSPYPILASYVILCICCSFLYICSNILHFLFILCFD